MKSMGLRFYDSWRSSSAVKEYPAVRILEVTGRTSGRSYRVLVLREERTGSEYRETLELNYKLEGETCFNPVFKGELTKGLDGGLEISITGGSVILGGAVPKGDGLGTYLMDEVVRWAKQWPEAKVKKISLAEVDGRDEANRLRRNRFYEQFGIQFDYHDEGKKEGSSRPMLAGDLTPVDVDRWKSDIVEKGLDQVLGELNKQISDLQKIHEQKQKIDIKIQKIEDHPFRYIGGVLLEKYMSVLILIFVLTIVLYKLFFKT